ncbi:MAG: EAL domain-containing protein [Sphaerochaetaceae bacterium]|nr:EAL domain-containing protein [Sphaerochaetaceae bacterium]
MYNYQFEACALFFLGFLLLHYLTAKKFPSPASFLFGVIIVLGILDVGLDVLASYAMDNYGKWPLWSIALLNNVFYVCQIVLPCFMSVLVLLVAGERPHLDRSLSYYLTQIPVILGLFIVITNPLTGLIFKVSDVNGTLLFEHGILFFPTVFGISGYYIVFTGIQTFVLRYRLGKRKASTMAGCVAIISVFVLVQFIFSTILLTGVAIAVAIMLMMFTFQSPEDMLDTISGTFNLNGFLHFVENTTILRKNSCFMTLELKDLDSLNQALGPYARNSLMRSVGTFLKGLGSRFMVFRISNFSFLIYVKDERSMEKAIETINGRFNHYWVFEKHLYYLKAEIYALAIDKTFKTGGELLEFLDEATENAKKRGLHGKLNDESGLLDLISRRKAVEEEIRSALKTKEGLYLVFQPICKAADKSLHGSEALLRYNSHTMGIISPAEFIPIVEKAGLAPELDAFVLKKACEVLKANPQIQFMDINLSAAEFFRNPAEHIWGIVNDYGIDSKRICFEITETSASLYPEVVERFMFDMLKKGFSFALDDFGTGYANLMQVVKLPFQKIKLDASLLEESSSGNLLLEAILDAFKSLNVKTVVEGVETIAQFRKVAKLGADDIQGFLYSKPLSEEDFIRFVERSIK